MFKSFIFVVLVIFVFAAACSESDDVTPIEEEEPLPFHYVHYDIEDVLFKDTLLTFDFNNNQQDDFWLELEWTIDTSTYMNDVAINRRYQFVDHLGAYSTAHFHERAWRVGDKVSSQTGESWISAASGIISFGTTDMPDFHVYMDSLRNEKVYYGFRLKSEDNTHYGWLMMRCFLIESFAINLNPEEPILIGQQVRDQE